MLNIKGIDDDDGDDGDVDDIDMGDDGRGLMSDGSSEKITCRYLFSMELI